jgi:hypothetical protein
MQSWVDWFDKVYKSLDLEKIEDMAKVNDFVNSAGILLSDNIVIEGRYYIMELND